MEAYSTIVQFFQEGGIFMIPIVAVFALGIAIAIERYIYLSVFQAPTIAGSGKSWYLCLALATINKRLPFAANPKRPSARS